MQEDPIAQSSHYEVRIRVVRPDEVLRALRSQPWGRTARMLPDGTIMTGAPDNQPAALAEFLIHANFVVGMIMPRESNLE